MGSRAQVSGFPLGPGNLGEGKRAWQRAFLAYHRVDAMGF